MGGGDEKDTTSAGEIALSSISNGCSPEARIINDGNETRECWVVDVECGEGDRSLELEEELVCRICHVDPSPICAGVKGLELISLGCQCKGDMGIAHRLCALAWFTPENNWCCEICGSFAENVYTEHCRLMKALLAHRSSSSSDRDDPSPAPDFEMSGVGLLVFMLSSITALAFFLTLAEMLSGD